MPVTVTAPSRLHFGLLRFEQPAALSFGGLGMMIEQPQTTLRVDAASEWSATGPDSERVLAFARSALAAVDAVDKPTALKINVAAAIPSHRGLGAGTQLGCAVAAAVRTIAGLPPGSAEELAALAGRGARSAVGCHGFVHGGLLWEIGRRPDDVLGRLKERVETPPDWRIVFVTPRGQHGLSGAAERSAFDKLPLPPEATVRRLTVLAEERILPAAHRAALEEFGEGVYEYGRLAGECFAPVQGGCYATAEIAECVAATRSLGVRGVGQSSWGPTVFAITESDQEARRLIDELAPRFAPPHFDLEIAAPNNRGAMITMH